MVAALFSLLRGRNGGRMTLIVLELIFGALGVYVAARSQSGVVAAVMLPIPVAVLCGLISARAARFCEAG
jgi:hypothetical protein